MDDLKEYIINKITTLDCNDIPAYVTDPDIARLVSSDEYFRYLLDRELSSRILEIGDTAVNVIDSLCHHFSVSGDVKVYEELVIDFECFVDLCGLVNFSVPLAGEAMQTTYARLLELRDKIVSSIAIPPQRPAARRIPDDDDFIPF